MSGPVDALRRLVRDRAGLEIEGARAHLLDAALARAAAAAGEAPDAHARALVDGARPLQPFLEELAVAETWFFRDPAQWAFVEQTVLPAARAAAGPFRAWSAGCASGEEPYSLAMLAVEAGLGGRTRIVATDLSESALARARRGEYSLWSLRGDGAARARRWLREADGRLAVDPRVAALVRFERLNLAEPAFPSEPRGLAGLDLVLCRNVLIYLDRAHVREIARRLHATLAPGGWLLTGASDPSLAAYAPFERGGPLDAAYRRPLAGRRAAPARRAPLAEANASRTVKSGRPRPLAGPRLARSVNVSPPAGAVRPAPPAACAGCRALLDAGRHEEALAAIDAAVAAEPALAELHLMRALVLAETGRLEGAEASLRRAQALAPGEPFVRFVLALVRAERGDRRGAARSLRRVLALCERRDPGDAIPLSEGLTAEGLAAAARHHLERLPGDGRGTAAS